MVSYCDRSFIERGNSVENLVGVLRNALAGRLQQHVDNGLAAFRQLAAAQHVAQELIFARRSAGKQQHPAFAIDHVDFHFALNIGLIFHFRKRLDLQSNDARPAVVMPGNVESHRHGFAIAAKRDTLGFSPVPALRCFLPFRY